jgi:hypothetical protein
MSNTATEFRSTKRFYLLTVSGVVKKVSKTTPGAICYFAENLSRAKMKHLAR